MASNKASDYKYALVSGLLPVLILALFINKAYFQDSYIYLLPADAILRNPLDPYNVDLGKMGILAIVHTHPPLTSYLIAPAAYFGDIMKEWQVNLVFILLAGVTAAALYYQCRGFVRHKLITALLFAVTPAFLISFSQVNADPVTLAFWVLSTTFFIAAVRKGSTGMFVLAGLCAGLASLATFNALVILPLFASYLLFKRYKRPNAMLTFLVAFAIFSLWCLQNYAYYGHIQILNAPKSGKARVDLDLIGQKTFSALGLLGGAGPFPLVYLYAFLKKRRDYLVSGAVLASVAAFVFLGGYKDVGSYTPLQKSLLVIFVTLGVLVVLTMLLDTVLSLKASLATGAKAEMSFFLLWFWVVILYNIMIMPFESARYLLPAYAPIALAWAHKAEEREPGREGLYLKVMGLSIGLSLVLSLGLLYADYRQADIYRDFSRKVEKGRYLEKNAYFEGSWGFWFYMEKQGATRYIIRNKPLKEGDIFIRPVYSSPKALEPDLQSHLQLVKEETYGSRFPMRTLGKSAEAGFYSQVWGFLPYSFSTDPLDTFSIYRYREEDLLQSDVTGTLGELYGTGEFKLYFVPEAAEINGMGFYVGTYMRENTGRLDFALRDETGRVLAEKTVWLANVRDNSWLMIDFPSVRVSPGNTCSATLSSPDSAPGNAITFYYSRKKFSGVKLMVNGAPVDGALAFAIYR